MAGNKNLGIRGARAKKEARDAYPNQAKESLAFSHFLLLAEMAEDAGLCCQDIRFVLGKFYRWLEPAGRANLAKLRRADEGAYRPDERRFCPAQFPAQPSGVVTFHGRIPSPGPSMMPGSRSAGPICSISCRCWV